VQQVGIGIGIGYVSTSITQLHGKCLILNLQMPSRHKLFIPLRILERN